MSLTLYGYWRSSASYRVRIAMHLKELSFDYVPVHLVKEGGQQNAPHYAKLNPSKLVPTFVDDDEDIILNQSLAIIEYLDEKYSSGIQLIPQHTLDRARVRALSLDIASEVQPLTNLRVLNRLKADWGADDAYIKQWQQSWMKQAFAAIESRLATRSGKYCFGYELSLADICLIPQVYNALRFEVDMQQFPRMFKIYENCNQLDAFLKASPEQQVDAD